MKLRLLFLIVMPQWVSGAPLFTNAPVHHGNIGASEGPAWHADGYLLCTGGGKITKRGADGNVSVFREDAGGANGLLFDHEGRLVVCEAARRRVTRTERDGTITVLADNYGGNRFNTPNDLAIDSRGRIYFSDPRYGSRANMELRDENGRITEGVYRIDAPGKVARIIAHEVQRPNGILVSPGDKHLYVADNNNNTVAEALAVRFAGGRVNQSAQPQTDLRLEECARTGWVENGRPEAPVRRRGPQRRKPV